MRKALPLGLGVTAAVLAAVFVGAAAAMTGAPVFYDARHPAAPSSAPDGYAVGSGTSTEQAVETPTDDGGQARADGAGEPPPTPGAPPGTPPDLSAPAPPSAPPAGPPTKAPGPPPDVDGGASDDIGTDEGTNVTPPTPDEQERWLAFQQVVRDCMAEAGQEYLYWEWWNPGPDTSNRFPAMPADLTPDEFAGWQRALNGNAGRGQDYRWQDAGCWGRAVHLTGGER